jgi:Bardet-Biedl syndrome 9 protein
MSVFQLQEWWNVQISQSEEFDFGCMVVGNVDNANPAGDKIVIGSQQGMLRIYSPTRPQYRVEDLYLEENLGLPILQVLLGLFIPSVENLLGLAVLHPKKLVVYEVVGQGMKDNKPANYYSLQKCYEHNLGLDGKHFTAYNMISGAFGGVRGREMMLVQSLDGKLQIFEQSANAFTRQLVDCLVPCPIAYLPKLDSFVATNYACHAECYRYQVLASSQADIGGGGVKPVTTGQFNLTALRSALVEWSLNMGESCLQMIEGNFSGSESTKSCGELLALCDQSLFLIKASGGIIQQRKLDHNPVCMCAYSASSKGNKQNFLLADRDGTIQVFSEFNLVWATKVRVHVNFTRSADDVKQHSLLCRYPRRLSKSVLEISDLKRD